MVKDKKIIDVLFIFILAYQVIYSSLWQNVFPSEIWSIMVIIFNFVLISFLVVDAIDNDYDLHRVLLLFILIIILCLYLIKKDTIMVILLAYLSISTTFNPKNLLKLYFVGICIGVSVVVMMSLTGILPVVGNSIGMYSFGFENPNTLGFYLVELFLLYLAIYQKQIKLKEMLILLCLMFFEYKVLDDNTANVVLVGTFFLYQFKNIQVRILNKNFFCFLYSLLPIFLFSLTIWISKNYLRYSWMSGLNSILSTRPNYWNYFFVTQDISMFGFNFLENGTGTLDNGYLNYLLIHGFISISLIMVILTFGIFKAAKKKDIPVLNILVILSIYAFVETLPFRSFQSILLPLAFCLVFDDNNEILQ